MATRQEEPLELLVQDQPGPNSFFFPMENYLRKISQPEELIIIFFNFYFWDYFYSISPVPFLPPNLPIYPSLLSFKFVAPLFISCCCMCLCICLYKCKSSLFCLYNAPCVYAFRADLLAQDKRCALPWRRPLLPSQLSCIAYGSLWRGEAFSLG